MSKHFSWLNQFKSIDDQYCRILIAYAAGDAFGAFYEFAGTFESIPRELKAKSGWPFGGISDDTALSLLTIQALNDQEPGKRFLALLKEKLPNLRGLGPTTRSALGIPVKPDELGIIGNTNGAMMRTALCGLANFSDDVIIDAIKVTHQHQEAIDYSLRMVNLFRGEQIPNFNRPIGEIGLHPAEAFEAVCYVVNHANSTAEAYEVACSLGGDTDTVAALSGALYLLNNPSDQFLKIGWLSKVDWPEIARDIDSAVETLRRYS